MPICDFCMEAIKADTVLKPMCHHRLHVKCDADGQPCTACARHDRRRARLVQALWALLYVCLGMLVGAYMARRELMAALEP